MAVPTTAEVKTFLAIPTDLTKYDNTIASQIAEAEKQVKRDGIPSSEDDYFEAVLLKTSAQIAATPLSSLINTSETDDIAGSGEVKKEKVADVETEYFPGESAGSSGGSGGGSSKYLGGSYEQEYYKLLRNFVGPGYLFGC